MRHTIEHLVSQIEPADRRERRHQQATLRWIRSDAPLFRTSAPSTPPQHLAVYTILLDEVTQSILLVDHIKAGLWVPPGGHVDVDEDPRETSVREVREELGIDVELHERMAGVPLFVSRTRTRGPGRHTDVTLWFVARGDRSQVLTVDPSESRGATWIGLHEGVGWSAPQFDPNMARFVVKLKAALAPRRQVQFLN